MPKSVTPFVQWPKAIVPRPEISSGKLALIEHFFDEAEATSLHQRLRAEVPFGQHFVQLFGKRIASPRLSSWHGTPEATYRYSGIKHLPLPFTPAMAECLRRLDERFQLRFNSVLANLYRDGKDSMGLHADDERELGPTPLIASLSFGTTRQFRLRHRTERNMRVDLSLQSGSLLLMGGTLQTFWKHEVPKAPRTKEERINLTFRLIANPSH
jgi:alkylated DNA repair dioxygenase AlkB